MSFDEIAKLVSMILGVLGFIISMYNLIKALLEKRRNVQFKVSEYRLADFYDESKLACFWFEVENNSQIPISITRITLIKDNFKANSYHRVHKVFETRTLINREVVDKHVTYSSHLPINLSSLGAFSGDLAFRVPQGILQEHETHLTFEIGTNRGKAFQKTFALCESAQTPEHVLLHT